MTAVLLAALVASVGLAALLGGATVWLAKRALGIAEQLRATTERVGKIESANAAYKISVGKMADDYSRKKEELHSEVAARKEAEAQRDRAVKSLVDSGDPDAVASSINASLGRLSDLS